MTNDKSDSVILLGLTTTQGSDWRGKFKEIEELETEELALFPTFLDFNDRKDFF